LVDTNVEHVIKIMEGHEVHDLSYQIKKGKNHKYIFNVIMLLSDNSPSKKDK